MLVFVKNNVVLWDMGNFSNQKQRNNEVCVWQGVLVLKKSRGKRKGRRDEQSTEREMETETERKSEREVEFLTLIFKNSSILTFISQILISILFQLII